MSQDPNQRQDAYPGYGDVPQSSNPYGTPPSQTSQQPQQYPYGASAQPSQPPQQYPYGTPAQPSQPAYYDSVTGNGSQSNYGTTPNYGTLPNYGTPPNYQQQNYGAPYGTSNYGQPGYGTPVASASLPPGERERKTNMLNCFAHPETNAVAQCSRCHKGICTLCTHSTSRAPFCFSCYESLLRAEIARANHSTVGVWIFTGAITLFAAITSIARGDGGAIILVIPLAFALSWCLFWGWTPVWKGFTRSVGGCIFGPVLLLIFGVILLAGIAILVGAGSGIQKYNEARRIIANGDQMLATLHGKTVQRI